jgi:metalloendopeptidase OMA1, mitochondrial
MINYSGIFVKSIFVLATVGMVFSACVTTPTGRKQLVMLPASQMNNMGVQAYSDMKKKEKISKDRKLTNIVVEVGKRIARASGANYKWEFTLFDSDKVNAFCLPGGKIGIYTGILPVAKNTAGLAAIMGHEVGHAIARHSNERVSQQLMLAGGLGLAGVALHKNKNRNLIMAGLGLGAGLGIMLPFSRKHESEADTIGLKYMAKAGYDPKEASKLWQRMNKKGGGGPPEILSTHPHPTNRSNALKNQVSDVWALYQKSNKQSTKSIPL